MNKKLNLKNKGITLVALVITIILLLILAGISIATLTGSGLFENAKEARDKWQIVQDEEEMQLAKYSDEIESYVGNSRNEKYAEELLWEFDSTADSSDVKSGTKTGELQLTQPVTNFDEIVFFGQMFTNSGCGQAMEVRILTSNLISNPPSNDGINRQFINTISIGEVTRRMVYNITANDKITINEYNDYRLLNIKGIKY